MTPLEFLNAVHACEGLKNITRHCDTSAGRRESVAEHCWRLSLMALWLHGQFPDLDMARVTALCLVHDLGELFTGDVPTFQKTGADRAAEQAAYRAWTGTLPEPVRAQMTSLRKELEAGATPEAKLCKALDRLEALIQHNEADIASWLPLEYELQQTYGISDCAFDPWLRALRQAVLDESLEKIAAVEQK